MDTKLVKVLRKLINAVCEHRTMLGDRFDESTNVVKAIEQARQLLREKATTKRMRSVKKHK